MFNIKYHHEGSHFTWMISFIYYTNVLQNSLPVPYRSIIYSLFTWILINHMQRLYEWIIQAKFYYFVT